VTSAFSRAGSVAAGSSITTISPPIRGEIATDVDGDEPVVGDELSDDAGRGTVVVVGIVVVGVTSSRSSSSWSSWS
ncbi:MAG: hypothetical protein ACK48T_01875, partial [Acidimicrobiaceae bacterium]